MSELKTYTFDQNLMDKQSTIYFNVADLFTKCSFPNKIALGDKIAQRQFCTKGHFYTEGHLSTRVKINKKQKNEI